MSRRDKGPGGRSPDGFGSFPSSGTFRIQRQLPGPIERVWAYITDPHKRRLWFADGPMQLRPSGEVSLHFQFPDITSEPTPPGYEDSCEVIGTITECRPPARLSYTWGQAPNTSHVTFELTEKGDEVLLVITHIKLLDPDQQSGVASGWHAHLELLREALGGSKAAPFWTTKLSMRDQYAKIIGKL